MSHAGDFFSKKKSLETYVIILNLYSVENLFQFLPQEKVNDLNDLKPVDRLARFQQAISDGKVNLMDKHKELMEFQNSRGHMGSKLDEKKQKLADFISTYERQKGKIETFKKYKEIKTSLRWINLQVLKTVYDQAVLEKKYAEEDYKEWEELHNDAKEKHLGKLQADKKILEKEFQKQEKKLQLEPENQLSQISKYVSEIDKARESVITSTKTVITEKTAIRDLEQYALKTKREIKAKEEEIKRNQDSYNKGMAEFETKQKKWAEEHQVLSKEEDKLVLEDIPTFKQKFYAKKTELEAKDGERKNVLKSINLANNTDARREEALKNANIQNFQNILQAKKWIESHMNEFQAEIIMPAIFSINAEGDAARALLHFVPYDNMVTFIARSKKDSDHLFKRVSTEKGLKGLSIAFMGDEELDLGKYRSQALPYKQYGFSHLLLNEIEGPDEMLAFLCKESKIHLVPWTRKNPKGEELNYQLESSKEERLTRYYVFGDIQQVISLKKMEFSVAREISEKLETFIPKEDYEYKPYGIRFDADVIAQRQEELRNVDKARLDVENEIGELKRALETKTKRQKVLNIEINKLTLQMNQKLGSKNEERQLYQQLQKLMEGVKDFPKIYLIKKKLQQEKIKKAIEHGKRYSKLQQNLLKKW